MTIVSDMEDYEIALQRAPYSDDRYVGKLTAETVAAGHSILQIHKLSDSDAEHVGKLLDLMAPAKGARILDAGCGVGRVAELMARKRPDLRFMLLNISRAQLAMCPPQFLTVHADFQETGLPDESFDAVMFNYSLGHGLLSKALAEAARVLRPSGILFIYDLSAADSRLLIDVLGYKAHSVESVCRAAEEAGFELHFHQTPAETTVADFLTVITPEIYFDLFRGVRPAVYRFIKC
jgi:SAM-dependent methyltransferase